MERQLSLPFRVGQEVEAKFNETGYRGAWFRCRIKELKDSKGGLNCLLEYLDFPDEEFSWTRARQAHPAAKSAESWLKGKKPLIWMIRPLVPPIIQESDLEEYKGAVWKKQKQAGSVAIFNNQYVVGDLVDWWKNECFWTGRIAEVFTETNKVEVSLLPPPYGEGGTDTALMKDLRPAFSWSLRHKWKLVPTKVCKGGMEKTKCEKPRKLLLYLSGNSSIPPAVQQCRSKGSGSLPGSPLSKETAADSGDKSQEVIKTPSQCNFGKQKKTSSDLTGVVVTVPNSNSSHGARGDGLGKNDFSARRRQRKRRGVLFSLGTNQDVHMDSERKKHKCSTAAICLSDSDKEEPRELVPQQKPPQPKGELGNEEQLTKENNLNAIVEKLGSAIAEVQATATSTMEDAEKPQLDIVIVGETTAGLENTGSRCSTQVDAENPGRGVAEVGVNTSVEDHEDEPMVEMVHTGEITAGLGDIKSMCSGEGTADDPGMGVAEVCDIPANAMDEPQLEIVISGEVTAGLEEISEIPCSSKPVQLIETLLEVQTREQKQKDIVGAARRHKMWLGRCRDETVRKALKDKLWRKRRRATFEGQKIESEPKRARKVDSEGKSECAASHDRNVCEGLVQDAVPLSAPSTPVYSENRDSLSGRITKWDGPTDKQDKGTIVGADPQLIVTLHIECRKENLGAAAAHQLELTAVEGQKETVTPTLPECCEEEQPMEVDTQSSAEPNSKECQADGTAECTAEKIPDALLEELDALERLTECINAMKRELDQRRSVLWKAVNVHRNKLSEGAGASMRGSMPGGKATTLVEIPAEADCSGPSGIEKCCTCGLPTEGLQGAQEGPGDAHRGMERAGRPESLDRALADMSWRVKAGARRALLSETADRQQGASVLQGGHCKQVGGKVVSAGDIQEDIRVGRRKRAAEDSMELDGRRTRTSDCKASNVVVPQEIVVFPGAVTELPRLRGSLKNQKQKPATRSQSLNRRPAHLQPQQPGMGKREADSDITHCKDSVAKEQQRLKEKSSTGHEEQEPSGGMPTRRLRTKLKLSRQNEPEPGTSMTGSEFLNGETEEHKIRMRSNGNWCIKAEYDGRAVWIGSYLTKEAALYAFDIVAGPLPLEIIEASQMEHTSSLPIRKPADQASPLLSVVQDIGASTMANLKEGTKEAGTSNPRLPNVLRRVEQETEAQVNGALEGFNVRGGVLNQGKRGGEDIVNQGKRGKGSECNPVEQGLAVVTTGTDDENVSNSEIAAISLVTLSAWTDEEIELLITGSSRDVRAASSIPETVSDPMLAGEPVPLDNGGGIVRIDKGTELNKPVDEEPPVRVEVPEAPAVRALEKGSLGAEDSLPGKECQGVSRDGCAPSSIPGTSSNLILTRESVPSDNGEGRNERIDEGTELNKPVDEEPCLSVEVTETPAVRAPPGAECLLGKECQAQACTLGNVKVEAVPRADSPGCSKNMGQKECLPTLKEPIDARAVLDRVSMQGFETSEEQEAARHASTMLWQSIYFFPQDPTKAMQGQELINRLEVLARTFSEVVVDGKVDKVVLRSGYPEEEIYLGHYRNAREVQAATKVISRCKKEFKKSLLTQETATSSTPTSSGSAPLASRAEPLQVTQTTNEQLAVGVSVPGPPSDTASSPDLPVVTQGGSSQVVLHSGQPDANTPEMHATGTSSDAAYWAFRLTSQSAQYRNSSTDHVVSTGAPEKTVKAEHRSSGTLAVVVSPAGTSNASPVTGEHNLIMRACAHTEQAVQLLRSIGNSAKSVTTICTDTEIENPVSQASRPASEIPGAQSLRHGHEGVRTHTLPPHASSLGDIGGAVHLGTAQGSNTGQAITDHQMCPAMPRTGDGSMQTGAPPVHVNELPPSVQERHPSATARTVGGVVTATAPSVIPENIIDLDDDDDEIDVPALPAASNLLKSSSSAPQSSAPLRSSSVISNSSNPSLQSHLLSRTNAPQGAPPSMISRLPSNIGPNPPNFQGVDRESLESIVAHTQRRPQHQQQTLQGRGRTPQIAQGIAQPQQQTFQAMGMQNQGNVAVPHPSHIIQMRGQVSETVAAQLRQRAQPQQRTLQGRSRQNQGNFPNFPQITQPRGQVGGVIAAQVQSGNGSQYQDRNHVSITTHIGNAGNHLLQASGLALPLNSQRAPAGPFESLFGSLQAVQGPTTGVTATFAAGNRCGEVGSGSMSVPRSNIEAAVQSANTPRWLYNCCTGKAASAFDKELRRALHCGLCNWVMHTDCAVRAKKLGPRNVQLNGRTLEMIVYTCNCQKIWGVLPSLLYHAKLLLQILNDQQLQNHVSHLRDPHGGQVVALTGLKQTDYLKEILSRMQRILVGAQSPEHKAMHLMATEMLFSIFMDAESANYIECLIRANEAIAWIQGTLGPSNGRQVPSGGGQVPPTMAAAAGGAPSTAREPVGAIPSTTQTGVGGVPSTAHAAMGGTQRN